MLTIVMVFLAILFFGALAWIASIILVPVLGVLIGIPLGIIRGRKMRKAGLIGPWPGHLPEAEEETP